MGFLDEVKDFVSVLRRLAGHWRLLAALVVLLGFSGLFLQSKFFPHLAVETSAPPAKPRALEGAPQAGSDDQKDKGQPQAEAEAPPEPLVSQMVEVAARPALTLKGQAEGEVQPDILSAALAKVSAAASKSGVTPNGHPLVVFTQSDDKGFHYEAMVPLAKAPEGKLKLADGVEIGATPAGKALKFEHRGPYGDIDSTYDAITAYLEEKGLDTQSMFIEEYLTDLNASDDANVDVDIYVFVK